MQTKLVMTASAIFLITSGLTLSFLPHESLNYIFRPIEGSNPHQTDVLQIVFQLSGALYFGFGMLNWMARHSVIGGIYNKPIVMANLALIGGLALLKASLQVSNLPPLIYPLTFIYLFFIAMFAVISFRHPGKSSEAA